ncbi:MAG: alpha/beta fold hydrolase [Deltaproteobacteria bacterium]|jgi:haloalkane dehalogenase|nr:alpha/beta fold hydrolase [Deltaproteobacteria bacterium]
MTGPFQPPEAKEPKPQKTRERSLPEGWPISLPAVPPGPWTSEYPFASKFFPLGAGQAIHYVDEGGGPPVVMVHGNPTWSFMFRKLISSLDGYRRIALDHLGMGLSSRPDSGYGFRLADRIRDFGAFISFLGLREPVHLVAHDWGGPIALGWAADNREKVASLALMNTGFKVPSGWRLPMRLKLFQGASLMSRLLAVEVNLFLGGLIRMGSLRPLTMAAESGFLAPYSKAAHRKALGAFIRDIPLSSGHPSREALAKASEGLGGISRKPVLLAWGLRDFVFSPAFLLDFQKKLPKAKVLPLEMAGHLLLEDEPQRILAALREHLARA